MTGQQQMAVTEDDIQALVDGRLHGADAAAVEAAVAQDAVLAARVAGLRADRAALRAALASKAAEPVPARLRAATRRPTRSWQASWGGAQLAAGLVILAVGLGGGWVLGRQGAVGPQPVVVAGFAQAAQLAHAVYSVEVAHPVEVGAADEGHLMAWLSKRLGRTLQAPDLRARGYALVGGRLLPGSTGAAAQLMYEDASGARLTLYVAAVEGGETAFRFAQGSEAASLTWVDAGMGFAVSAALPRARLLPIAEDVYHALAL
jgi:anti-sigma factor RsiW